MRVNWTVSLVALKSFNDHAEGDVFQVELTDYWAHLVAYDYVKVVQRWPTQSASTDSPSKQ